jgi:YggT family protein
MNGYLTNPVEFIITTLFQLYITVVMLRFLLQWVRADFYNPVSQFLVKVTNPALKPLRRLIPGWGGLDIAAVILMIALQVVSLLLVLLLRGQGVPVGTLVLWSLAELVSLAFNVFIFAIIIQVILSWVNPGHYNPVSNLLYSLTEPLLRPARRMLPPISGIDLSPLLVLLALQVLKMLIIPPLMHLAMG